VTQYLAPADTKPNRPIHQHAKVELETAWILQRKDVLACLLERYQIVYRQAMEDCNFSAAIGALNGLAKLSCLI